MKRSFKLYWVETPAPEENAFIAAYSKRQAAKYEEDETGFNSGDCIAELIRPLADEWVKKYTGAKRNTDPINPFYVQFEDLHELNVRWSVIEGDDVFAYGDRAFLKQGDLNYLASLGNKSKNIVIRSVSDLFEVIARDAPGDWIFRGHYSCRWQLKASVHRLIGDSGNNPQDSVEIERKILSEFKRRARTFLENRPGSDWEWMVIAQHFGLPTRILDWTENPLVALYFAVRDDVQLSDDGLLFAYRHGRPEIDIESSSDPFSIQHIELVRPPHLDQRVIAQQSVFTVEPLKIDNSRNKGSDIRYWYVSVKHKREIRRELSKLGVSESSLFPGLASLAQEIKNDFVWTLRNTPAIRTKTPRRSSNDKIKNAAKEAK